MAHKTLVSIVLGAYNRLELLKVVIANARDEVRDLAYEIIVVDGGSTDGSLEWLLSQKDIITIVQHNRGDWDGKTIMRRSWGYFMNLAFKTAQSPHILMISDDTLFHKGAVQKGLDYVEAQKKLGKRVGAVPFFFHDVNLEPPNQYKIGVLFGNRFLSHGIYMREAFESVGFADEENFMFYGSDIDICFKLIHAGYEILPCPDALMLHCPYHPLRHTIENRDDIWREGTTALMNKWRGIYVAEGATLDDVVLEFEWVTFVDNENLSGVFDKALSDISEVSSESSIAVGEDLEKSIQKIENRLNNINSSVRYHIKLSEEFQARIYQEIAKYTMRPPARPLYRQILSDWKIFAPLRWIKRIITSS